MKLPLGRLVPPSCYTANTNVVYLNLTLSHEYFIYVQASCGGKPTPTFFREVGKSIADTYYSECTGSICTCRTVHSINTECLLSADSLWLLATTLLLFALQGGNHNPCPERLVCTSTVSGVALKKVLLQIRNTTRIVCP